MEVYKNIILLFLAVISTSLHVVAQEVEKEQEEISARLSANAIITKDLEATVKFYTEFLGYSVYKRITIDNPKSLSVFGVKKAEKLDYVSLLPSGWSKENPTQSGFNIIEIPDATEPGLNQDGAREPIMSEIIFAFSVKGLVEIEKKMSAARVEVVVPFSKSATGKSYALTILDPNGIRVQLYEFLTGK